MSGISAYQDLLVRSHFAARRQRRRGWMLACALILLAVVAAVGGIIYFCGTTSKAERDSRREGRRPEAKYVLFQLLPDQGGRSAGRLVRAIVADGGRCPTISQGSHETLMHRRAPRVSSAFPILLCEAELDAASDAWIGSRHLPTRSADPGNIAVIGDTGCRIVHYGNPQRCHSGVEWPFATISAGIANALRDHPADSIIIHVGDFIYREKGCADDNPDCAQSPFGDNWPTWEAEFFAPARPMLLSAPWVILRGNHENCARAGAGWLFFFAMPDEKYGGICEDDLPKHAFRIGGTANRPRLLVVLDTANEKESNGLCERGKKYQAWIDELAPAGAEVWLALHQPLWQYDSRIEKSDSSQGESSKDVCEKEKRKKEEEGTSALDVIRAHLLQRHRSGDVPKVTLLLSGDTHLFEFVAPSDRAIPVQIVAGNSGTRLDSLGPADGNDRDRLRDDRIGPGAIPGSVLAVQRYGYVTMHRNDADWTIDLRDIDGRSLVICRISEPSDDVQRQSPRQSGCEDENESSGNARSRY